MKRFLLVPALLAAGLPLSGAGTATWEMNTYADFLKGKLQGVSLTRDGRLRLAPKLETVFSSDEPAVWSVVQTADGTLYLGTGHRGRLYRVAPDGASEVIWTAGEPEIFALALDPSGRLYAATSPRGKVYRIEHGQASVFCNPGAAYIWSLVFAPDGTLYIGTGDRGRILRVDLSGKVETYYETGQSHVTALALDSAGRLLAGTEPNGILYRITSPGKAFVLYDANLPEIRSIVPAPDGTVYAAALGGSVAKQTAAALRATRAKAAAPVVHTSVTVSAAQGGIEVKPQPAKPKPVPAPAATYAGLPVVQLSGVEKSALFRIRADNTVDKIWTSTSENAYDLVAHDGKLFFVTDKRGRLYELTAGEKVTLMLETGQGEAIRLLDGPRGRLMATGNMGRIYRVLDSTAGEGLYEAPAHDAGRTARWGRLSWELFGAGSGEVEFQTRSGNSARPDRTWSEWSAPLTDPSGGRITSPNARFIQWRARFRASAGASPDLGGVRLAYLPQNAAPKVTAITVTSKVSSTPASSAAQTTSPSAATAAYSVTVTSTGESGASTVSGTSTLNLGRSATDQIRVAWTSEDLDGDRLVYALYFRGLQERKWKLLKGDLTEASYTLDSNTLADGKYLFRVVASDRRANPPSARREGDRVSAPVLVDHTPPVITIGPVRKTGANIATAASAADAASPLTRIEYSLDAGEWVPVSPEDGIVDSKQEQVAFSLISLPAGEHLLVVRAIDSAGNAGLAKTVIR